MRVGRRRKFVPRYLDIFIKRKGESRIRPQKSGFTEREYHSCKRQCIYKILASKAIDEEAMKQKEESRIQRKFQRNVIAISVASLLSPFALLSPATSHAQVRGAAFTSNQGCTAINQNIYNSIADVYINGGPLSAQLSPDIPYYVQVTDPQGTVLGKSKDAVYTLTKLDPLTSSPVPNCAQLTSLMDGGSITTTTNTGGEYKVWICATGDFLERNCKTDNFKIRTVTSGNSPTATVNKFYDASMTGVRGTQTLLQWPFTMEYANQSSTTCTAGDSAGSCTTSKTVALTAGEETTFSEGAAPVATANDYYWVSTTPPIVKVLLDTSPSTTEVNFGNVCINTNTTTFNGLTLGYWSNNNGAKILSPATLPNPRPTDPFSGLPYYGLELVASLPLYSDANKQWSSFLSSMPTTLGTSSPYSKAYSYFKNWLLSASATDMRYMLSAQYVTMRLNIWNKNVDPSAIIEISGNDVTGLKLLSAYAAYNWLTTDPAAGVTIHNYQDASGKIHTFASLKDVLILANTLLTSYSQANYPSLTSLPDVRDKMELVKSIIDAANNSKLPFVTPYNPASGSTSLCGATPWLPPQ
jgi:hypothetical protein